MIVLKIDTDENNPYCFHVTPYCHPVKVNYGRWVNRSWIWLKVMSTLGKTCHCVWNPPPTDVD